MTCGVVGGEEGKAVELDTLRKCGSGKWAFLHNALQSGHDSRHAKYLGRTLKPRGAHTWLIIVHGN